MQEEIIESAKKLSGVFQEHCKEEPVLQFFKYEHLPSHLQAVSCDFFIVAMSLCLKVKRNPERTVALRKLLEAKDAAVRSVIYKLE